MNSQHRIDHIRKLSRALDAKFEVGGIRIGWDALIGLIPGIGDFITGMLSLYIVVEAIKLGASASVIIRMLLNILFESILGVIPIVGDILDIFWRANLRNLALIESMILNPKRTRTRSSLLLAAILLTVITILAALIAIPAWLVLRVF